MAVAAHHHYRPAPGQIVPLVVLGATDGVRTALDAAGIGHVEADDPEQAAEIVDRTPGAVLGYAPGVFGRALSARPARVAPADDDAEPIRALVLVDGLPDETPGVVDDDPRRLMYRARVPLRVSSWCDVTDPAHVAVLLDAVRTL